MQKCTPHVVLVQGLVSVYGFMRSRKMEIFHFRVAEKMQ